MSLSLREEGLYKVFGHHDNIQYSFRQIISQKKICLSKKYKS